MTTHFKFFLLSTFFLNIFYPATAQFQLQNFASGFTLPLGLYHAGDERLFVVEKSGIVKIIMPDGTVNSTPFLDIQNLVRFTGQTNSEQGLLGFAFHPDFKTNGYFFVDYTRSFPANDGTTVIARYQVNPLDSNVANANSAEIILTIPQQFSNHNGGCIQFGLDGFLYIGMGDGGSANDPLEAGQNPQTLQGKMLRLDVNSTLPFAIPSDNPFVNDPNVLDEIWAIGVRNPWRFSFDRITGDMWMGDVGQNNLEEINFQPSNSLGGENYGWDCFEGSAAFEPAGCNNITFTFPVFEYNHNAAGGFSVTGGYVFRSAKYKEAWGKYLFADAVSAHLWSTEFDGNNFNTIKEMNNTAGSSNVSFGEDKFGDLYLIKHAGGTIQKIIETSNSGPLAFITNKESQYSLCEGDSLLLQALFHPDLQFQWLKDGQAINNADQPFIPVFEAGQYQLVVADLTNASLPTDTSLPVAVVIIPATANLFLEDSLTVNISEAPFVIPTNMGGGTFTGTGIVNNEFDASAANLENTIVYTVLNNNCPQSDTLIVLLDTLSVGAAQFSIPASIHVFPNPVTSHDFKIVASHQILSVQITDVLGVKIYQNQHLGLEHHIHLPELTSGVYFAIIQTEQNTWFKKLYVYEQQ